MEWVTSLEHQIVSCDTAPIIYYIETNPAYIKRVDPFFNALDQGKFQLVTSTITLLEVLIHTLRQGNTALAQQYEQLLHNTRNVQIVAVSSIIAQTAARIRATYNLRTPDAIQIATAIEQGSTFLVTNDPNFQACA
jgi:predicted nucleic acid-binding protein